LVGFNALTSAARLGHQGAAMSVLAQNLTVLAHSDGVVATRIAKLADALGAHVQDIAKTRAHMVDLAREGLGHSDLPVAELYATVDAIISELGAITVTAKGLRSTMDALMVGLQREDILRQGIDHVRLVFDVLHQEHSLLPESVDLTNKTHRDCAESFLAFQESATTLAATLLGDAQTELGTLIEETYAGIDGMGKTLQLLTGVREQVNAGIRGKLRLPAAVFEQLGNTLTEQVKESLRFREVVQGLATLANRLPSEFTNLHEICIQLRAVRILMRTEIARSTAASSTAAIVADIGKGETELGTFLDVNRKEAILLDAAQRALTEVSDHVYRHCQQLSSLEGQLRQCPEKIVTAGDEFSRRFETVARASEGMRTSLGFTGESVASYRARLHILFGLQKLCEELAVSAGRLRIELFGGESYDNQPSGRLSEIIDHFTIFAHKQIGGAMTGVAVAEGDAEGTLTLF